MSFALGLVAVAVSWSPVGLLGLAAGIAALVIGAGGGQRTGEGRSRLAMSGMVLGAAGIAIAVGIAIYGIVHAIGNGTFERG